MMSAPPSKPTGARPAGARPLIINGEVTWVAPSSRVEEDRDSLARGARGAGPGHTTAPSWRLWLAWAARSRVNLLLLACTAVALVYTSRDVRVGAVVCLVALALLLLANLGKREAGSLSAYSIFNPGHKSLAGDLRAEHWDAQIRGGPVGGLEGGGRPDLRAVLLPGAGGAGGGGEGRRLGGGEGPGRPPQRPVRAPVQDEEEEEEEEDAELAEALRQSREMQEEGLRRRG